MNTQQKKATTEESKQRDKWDYIEILARPIAATLTALAIGLLGYYGQRTLSFREAELTKRERSAQNYRLYTELLSRREESESALRKDMFQAILKQFLIQSNGKKLSDDVSKMLLKLELLALNFGESLSLSPLFIETNRAIDALRSSGSPTYRIEQDAFQGRLLSLAKRVSSWQLSALSAGGKFFEFDVPIELVQGGAQYVWPSDYVSAKRDEQINNGLTEDFIRKWSEQVGLLKVENITRNYIITFSRVDLDRQTVRVALEIYEVGQKVLNPHPTEMEFDLNFFNFPMVDNTRLSGNQRFALIMEDFDQKKGFIKVAGICFPGLYATQRDKPFLNEVIDKLNKDDLNIKMPDHSKQ